MEIKNKSLVNAIDSIKKEAKKEVISEIPTSWLDSLFDKYLKRKQNIFDCNDIENMFMELKKRLEEHHLSTSNKKGKIRCQKQK